jgi:hypothetical protein
METLESLSGAVSLILDTAFLEPDEITRMINRQQLFIAGGGRRGYGQPLLGPLPDLGSIFTISTIIGDNTVALPTEYHRRDSGKVWIASSGETVPVSTDRNSFYHNNVSVLGKSGGVYECCITGRQLLYASSPAESVDISVIGYRKPVDMTRTRDTPDGIPEHLQYPLLVDGTAYMFWSMLDQDANKPIHNTNKHKAFFEQALDDLQIWIHSQSGAYNLEVDEGQFIS